MRSRKPLVKITSPSAIPVYGLSDQTATVELVTLGWAEQLRGKTPIVAQGFQWSGSHQ
jgi:hypothetical protein